MATKRKRKPVDYNKISTQEPAAKEAADDITPVPSLSKEPNDISVEPPADSEDLRAPQTETYRITTPLLNVRQKPSFDAEKAGYFQYEGNLVEVEDTITSERGDIWAKLVSGYYICMYNVDLDVWFVEKWSD